MSLAKRIVITLAILATPFILGLLLTYQVIKVQWVSQMAIQPSYRSMEDPLPLPKDSVPVQGAAYVQGYGSPQNPVKPDDFSLSRGEYLYSINCSICHGPQGKGDGPVAASLRRKPADLTGPNAVHNDDGTIFTIVSNGVPNMMPPLRENLTPRDRWDIVNYVRKLQKP